MELGPDPSICISNFLAGAKTFDFCWESSLIAIYISQES
jgi:hypothetical protein